MLARAGERSRDVNEADVREAIRRSGLFGVLEDDELDAIAMHGAIERYRAGETVYRQGDVGRLLYVIASGEAQLERSYTINGDRRVRRTVLTLREGRIMGCWLGLTGREHQQMCTAVCHKDVVAVVFECQWLRDIIDRHPEMGVKLFAQLITILKDRLEITYSVFESI
jgi:thioredoxin reductase (NADPH)